eukprot:356995-Chlamydomonas_euryale.AAC.9
MAGSQIKATPTDPRLSLRSNRFGLQTGCGGDPRAATGRASASVICNSRISAPAEKRSGVPGQPRTLGQERGHARQETAQPHAARAARTSAWASCLTAASVPIVNDLPEPVCPYAKTVA